MVHSYGSDGNAANGLAESVRVEASVPELAGRRQTIGRTVTTSAKVFGSMVHPNDKTFPYVLFTVYKLFSHGKDSNLVNQ